MRALLLNLAETLSQYWWVLIVAFSIAAIFCFMEACIPSFGFLGISGIVLFVLGVVYYILMGAELWKILLLILAIIAYVVGCFFWLSKSVKSGMLGKSPFFDRKTALPVDYDTRENEKFQAMIGQIGVCVTDLRPVGKAIILGKEMEVMAQNGYITKDEEIVVVFADAEKIIVDKFKNNDDSSKVKGE